MDNFFANDTAAIVGFITCGVISALFSGAETAITGLGSLKAKHILDTRGDKAKELNLWLHHPSRVLSTILLFNTAVNILASAIATEYANKYFENKALAVATGFTTLVILILCEIIPKTIGKIYTETLAIPAMKFVYFCYKLTMPIVIGLSYLASTLIEMFGGGKHQPGPQITEEELEFLVNVGEKAGVFEETKQDMISGVFEFDEIKVREIMTPRTDMTAIELKTPLHEAVKLAYESGHARIPVYDERIDNVVGILLAKDLLQFAANPEKMQTTKIQHLMRKPRRVPESKLIMDVFKELKRTKTHMAIVIDEYGGTAGLITLEDMLEEIVGEIQDEHDEEQAKIIEISPGIYDVMGQMNLDEFLDFFEITPAQIHAEGLQEAETVAGYMIQVTGDLPKVGQSTTIGPLVCEVSQVVRHRVERVRVRKNQENAEFTD
jgi:CBS domain containing-hemolysin-like protein